MDQLIFSSTFLILLSLDVRWVWVFVSNPSSIQELLPSQQCLCLRLCGQLMKQTEKPLNFDSCFYSLSSAKNYKAFESDLGGSDFRTLFFCASVPERYLGVGWCGDPFNHTDKLLLSQRCTCFRLYVPQRCLGVGLCAEPMNHAEKLLPRLSLTFASFRSTTLILFEQQHQLALDFSFFLEISRDMTSIVLIVFVLTRCFRSRKHGNCMNRRPTNLGSHIWSRRKIFWRHAGVSRDTYIACASKNLKKLVAGGNENILETPFGIYSASCSKISKLLCGKINACSTAAASLSGKQKRIQFCKRRFYTVGLLPFIFIPLGRKCEAFSARGPFDSLIFY